MTLTIKNNKMQKNRKLNCNNARLLIFILLFAAYSGAAHALSIGISPGRANFQGVLRAGYSERTVTISTGSDEEIFATFNAQGEIRNWVRFDTNETSFSISKDNPYKLKIIVEPPSDTRIGNYSGDIEFITEGSSGGGGMAGAAVKTAVSLRVNLEVSGDEKVECRAGAFNLKDAEVGFPLEFSYNTINDGNVRLRPTLTIDVWDQMQEKLIFTRDFLGDEVLPTTEKKISGFAQNPLGEGQYWASMSSKECRSNGIITFNVVEKGGISDKGELKEIINKPWAYTKETVQITARFQNSGERAVTAQFKGAIRLDDRIVRLVETDEVIVPAGEISDFDIFFNPEQPGRYTLIGRVVYNKKLTYEKGTVINVNASPEEETQKKLELLPLIVYLIIIATITFIIRKIMKERKKRIRF